MADTPDRVALVHPKLPGVAISVHPRSVASRAARGWVAPKSPAADPVDEPPTSLEGTTPTPSKEDQK